MFGPGSSARSVRPSLLKSPETTRTPGACAQPPKSEYGWLVIRKVPSPLEKATGIVYHQGMFGPGSRARRDRRSLLKSPEPTRTPGVCSQPPKSEYGWLVIRKVPSPLEKATGIVYHQGMF